MSQNEVDRIEALLEREARRTMQGRIILLSAVLMLLGANLWVSVMGRNTVVQNIDQARLDQSALQDLSGADLVAIQGRLDRIESDLALAQK
jgi:hypothetical protein